jgi:hypothetical protein
VVALGWTWFKQTARRHAMNKTIFGSIVVFLIALSIHAHSQPDLQGNPATETPPSFPVCTEFPTILGSGSPSGAVTGYPFTFFVRFSCLLSERFALGALEGVYRLPSGTELPSYIGIPSYRLRDGNILYQFFHSIPLEQEGGTYEMKGCVRVDDRLTQTSICLPVSATMRVRPRL